MEELQKEIFLPEYSQLTKDKRYQELIVKYEKEKERRKKEVFGLYASVENGHYVENQLYNEKNSAVEILSILLEVKEDFKKIDLAGVRYLLEEIEDRIKGHTEMIEGSVGGLNNGLTMSVYTYSDILLRGANAYESIIGFYDNLKDSLKKHGEDENTLTEVEEDV